MTEAHVLVPDGMDPQHAQRALNLLASHEAALHRVATALAQETTPTDPATAAMLATLDTKWRALETDYGVYDTAQVATMRGVTNRSSVHRLREARGLVAYKRANRRLYPAFQFHQNQAIDMRPLTTPLRAAQWSDEDIIMWLISTNAYTPDQQPPVRTLIEATHRLDAGLPQMPAQLVELATAAAVPAW